MLLAQKRLREFVDRLFPPPLRLSKVTTHTPMMPGMNLDAETNEYRKLLIVVSNMSQVPLWVQNMIRENLTIIDNRKNGKAL